jgi:endonuclease YncB( thermonuclease family)
MMAAGGSPCRLVDKPTVFAALALGVASECPTQTLSADLASGTGPVFNHGGRHVEGQAVALDGQTIWFPVSRTTVKLAGINTCALSQWAYDPRPAAGSSIPKPVPCGPFAKAWLTRILAGANIVCRITTVGTGVSIGRCVRDRTDISAAMLAAGWARLEPHAKASARYMMLERSARRARYGIWATYVLDMYEWQKKAVNKTLTRQPIADFNLLAERENEISPPFVDARARPSRTDR